MSVKLVDIVFDGPPSHVSGRFVEVEDQDGKSIRAGKWIHRSDGYWALQLEIETSDESNDSPGVKAIADERTRQIKKGYTPQHDAEHGVIELIDAGLAFGEFASWSPRSTTLSPFWPKGWTGKRPESRRNALVKAGAMMAAAIDLLDYWEKSLFTK